ncbi:MAG TPA: hypothetical protein VFF27_07020 [Bacteroidia bacterium]|jgi:hypothetical protein|nr:hypothetical protein [Bacteroidia bacterium]
MKKIKFIMFLTIVTSCVKDPKNISPNQLFSLTVDNGNFDNAKFIADKSIIYKIEIETLENINIDDGKQVAVSVSEGNLASVSNLSSNPTSTQINLTLQGGKATFFYSAGRKAAESAMLSLNLESISQIFKFKIYPSEPVRMQLISLPINPRKSDNIEVSAYLFKNNNNDQFCSDNLKIDFETFKSSTLDSIQPDFNGTSFSYSKYDELSNFVIAKKTVTTNKVLGNITTIARYLKTDGTLLIDTINVKFTQ